MEQGAERERVETFGRLENGLREAGDWYLLGPVPERAAVGHGARGLQRRTGRRGSTCPHDHARSRAYRWGEDGLAGFSDVEQRLCLGARAVERPRPDPQGAHLRADRERRATTARTPRSTGGTSTRPRATPGTAGATTTRSARSRTSDLVDENAPARQATTPSTSCSTPASSTTTATGSSRPTTPRPTRTTCCMTVRITNAGPEADTLHVLPTAVVPQHLGLGRRAPSSPELRADAGGSRSTPSTRSSGRSSCGDAGPDGAPPELLFCDNETNAERLFGSRRPTPYPEGRHQRPRRLAARRPSTPSGTGTKAAFWYRVDGRAGRDRRAARCRLRRAEPTRRPVGATSTT